VATFAAIGFLNREATPGKLYYGVSSVKRDEFWLNITVPFGGNVSTVSPVQLIREALQRRPVICYSSTSGEFFPATITMAAVMGWLPLSERLVRQLNVSRIVVVLNATDAWATVEEATRDVMNCCLNGTTSLAIQDPRYLMDGILVDWIIFRKLFVFYMDDMCFPWTRGHALLKEAIDRSPWSRPIAVYGYNSQNKVFGASPWEAETSCNTQMGQIASSNTTNLSFFSRLPMPTKLRQPPPPKIASLSPPMNSTPVALVYGDMDNIDFVMDFYGHMQQRVAYCNRRRRLKMACFPFTWTLSPNLLDLGKHRSFFTNENENENEKTHNLRFSSTCDALVLLPSGV
jgi:hypothetical protein